MIKLSFLNVLFFVLHITLVLGNDGELSDLLKVDYEGVDKENMPEIKLEPVLGTVFQKLDDNCRSGNCLQLEGENSQLISIINTKGELVAPSNGVMLSMWIRGELATDSSKCQLLVQSNDQFGKVATKVIGTSKLYGTKWTWLAAWYFREKNSDAPTSFILEIQGKEKVVINDIVLTYPPERLPDDTRPPLSIEEDKIMEGNKQILLQGVNLPSYSSKDKDFFSHELSISREEDYQDIAALGFNTVRLNLWYNAMVKVGGWKWLDIHRLWAQRHGLRLILDLHAPPGGYQSPMYEGDYWKDNSESKELRNKTIQFWQDAARRFRDDPTIAAIDLINEPRPFHDAQWWEFARKAIKLIRAEGFQQPIIVENSFAEDAKFELLEDTGIIYDFHYYDPWFFASGQSGYYNTACLPDEKEVLLDKSWLEKNLKEGALNFVQEHKVPLNVGEYGISYKALELGGELWLKDLTELLDQYHISRQYWCWHTYMDFTLDRSGWNRHYPSEINENIVSIISNKKKSEKSVTKIKGLVAFWDFEFTEDSVWTSQYDPEVVEQSFPVYLKQIGDTLTYLQNNWPYNDIESACIQFDKSGPFGNAIRFNQGYIFGEVPRSSFDNTVLDIHGREPFTIIAWVKFIGERHMVAGIWDEGGWNKYSGNRQAALFSGLFGDQKGVIAHISATGAASFPQSTIDGSQYARLRAIDGKGFENDQWVCMAMTFNPDSEQVTAYLNGKVTKKHQTDPVAQDVYRYENEELSNPYQYKWPVYSPRSFILKFNGYDAESSGINEHWLHVDLNNSNITYGLNYPENVKVNKRYRINLDIHRNGNSILSYPLKFEAKDGDRKKLQIEKMIIPDDILITSLELRNWGKWKRVGSEVRYTISKGAPFTFGRALGLGSEDLDEGTELFIDGVAVFNRVLSEDELRKLSFGL